jgi:hypothetical protein
MAMTAMIAAISTIRLTGENFVRSGDKSILKAT